MNVIIVNCFDTYEHRVDLIRDVLINNGNSVRVLTSNYRHIEKVKRSERKTDYKFLAAIPYKRNMSLKRMYSHWNLSNRIFKYIAAKISKVDLIWILLPPNSLAKEAVKYKRSNPNVKIIFDLIDLWPETIPIGALKEVFPFSIWRNLRDKNIQYADYVVTECTLFNNKLLKKLHPDKTETVYLARPIIPYEPCISLPEDKISLCYLGSINNIIDIDTISNIISLFKQKKPVELHIIGDGEKKDSLIRQAKIAGSKVIYHGKIFDRDKKQKIFDICHYGLNIMKESVCVGLTMKSIDYMEFGLPIINNIKGDTWDIVNKYDIGINYTSGLEISDYDYRQRVNTRQFFEDNFNKNIFSNKINRIINETMA